MFKNTIPMMHGFIIHLFTQSSSRGIPREEKSRKKSDQTITINKRQGELSSWFCRGTQFQPKDRQHRYICLLISTWLLAVQATVIISFWESQRKPLKSIGYHWKWLLKNTVYYHKDQSQHHLTLQIEIINLINPNGLGYWH